MVSHALAGAKHRSPPSMGWQKSTRLDAVRPPGRHGWRRLGPFFLRRVRCHRMQQVAQRQVRGNGFKAGCPFHPQSFRSLSFFNYYVSTYA